MNTRKTDSAQPLGSDMAKVAAHQIQPEEYVELPELTDEMFANATLFIGDRRMGPPQLGPERDAAGPTKRPRAGGARSQ